VAEKLFVDEIVLSIFSLAFNYFGLSLSITPDQTTLRNAESAQNPDRSYAAVTRSLSTLERP
jgi:hypothetical protein